ncbi:MAG: hypothetical protein Devi2KO_40860 [Devosia indica]
MGARAGSIPEPVESVERMEKGTGGACVRRFFPSAIVRMEKGTRARTDGVGWCEKKKK